MIILIIFIALNFIQNLNCQYSICSYENNIDYYVSVSLTYASAQGPQYCCALCSAKTGCVVILF